MSLKKKNIKFIDIKTVMPKDVKAQKCAPTLEFKNGSCIPLELLIKMAESYNKYHAINNSNKKFINLNNTLDTLYPNEYKIYLLNEFNKKFEGDQKEWINSKYLELMNENDKEYLEYKVFRPEGPQGQFEWLSTIDINKVLFQYEEKYPDFKFLGAVPIDFENLNYLPFKNLNFQEMETDGTARFGVIFNTDKSYQSGKHWMSLFCDLVKGQIYFSDSMGTRPPKEVNTFMKKIEHYIKKKNINVDIRYNKLQHQKSSTECGVYSINFILRLLKGKSFDRLTTKRLADNKVNKCRIKYFG
jgi:hypothetical protein